MSQRQEIVIVETGVLCQLKSDLAIHFSGRREADEVVPEFPAEGSTTVGDLGRLVAYVRLSKALGHVVSLRLTAFWRTEIRSDC